MVASLLKFKEEGTQRELGVYQDTLIGSSLVTTHITTNRIAVILLLLEIDGVRSVAPDPVKYGLMRNRTKSEKVGTLKYGQVREPVCSVKALIKIRIIPYLGQNVLKASTNWTVT